MEDQVIEQDRPEETVKTDDLEILAKEKAELEERYKKETQGLNRKISELEKAMKEKEREGLDAVERERAELEDLKREREAVKQENERLKRNRLVDAALSEAGIPIDLFADRITGSTEDEIKEDVARLKAYLESVGNSARDSATKEFLKGKTPPSQESKDGPRTLEEVSKIPDKKERLKALKELGYL